MRTSGIRLVGEGPVRDRIATLLADDRATDRLWLAPGWRAPAPARTSAPLRTVPSTRGRRSGRDGCAAGPPASSLVQVRAVNHWTKPDDARPVLTVLVSPTVEVDRAVTDRLTRDGARHLTVTVDRLRARIGPLIVPGVTACTGCGDLDRRDHDPAWPARLLEAMRTPVTAVPGLLVDWSATQVALQSYALLRVGYCDVTGCSLELDLDDPVTRVRHWTQHHLCGCAGRADAGPGLLPDR